MSVIKLVIQQLVSGHPMHPLGLMGSFLASQMGEHLRITMEAVFLPTLSKPFFSFSKVMDLLLDVVGKAVGGRYEDEKPDNDYSYAGYEEEGEEEQILDD